MTDKLYPESSRPTLDDLDPESATTDRLIEIVHHYPDHGEYPTVTVLLGNLPKALRLLCDHLLSGEATALDMAYRVASIGDAIEGCQGDPEPARRMH